MTAPVQKLIINNTEYSFLSNKMDEFRVLSKNEEQQYIFNKMTADLDLFKNKTRLENYFDE